MSLFSKIYKTLSLIKHWHKFTDHDSYYPNEEHKSKATVILDQLYFIWRYGDVEPFYFTYGFDRKEMSRKKVTNEYLLPFSQFQNRIKYLSSHHPKYGGFNSWAILADKFYFFLFLSELDFGTPKVYGYINHSKPLYFDPSFRIDTSLSPEDQLRSFLSNEMDAFAKPFSGQCGKGVFSLKISENRAFVDGSETPLNDLIDTLLTGNYIIQERVKQHPQMGILCPSAINTIRLHTVMDKNGRVHPFGAGLRIGRIWNHVDNWAQGGVFVGIDMQKGTLKQLGFLKPGYGTSTTKHPDTGIEFNGFEIPFYKEAESMAIKLHRYLYRCHSVGWDIAITEQGPVFIEGNGLWEISMAQTVHGGLKDEIEGYFK